MTPEIQKKRAEDLADMLADKLKTDYKKMNPRDPSSDDRGWICNEDKKNITVFWPEQGVKVAFTIHYLDSPVHVECCNGIDIEIKDNEQLNVSFDRILKACK